MLDTFNTISQMSSQTRQALREKLNATFGIPNEEAVLELRKYLVEMAPTPELKEFAQRCICTQASDNGDYETICFAFPGTSVSLRFEIEGDYYGGYIQVGSERWGTDHNLQEQYKDMEQETKNRTAVTDAFFKEANFKSTTHQQVDTFVTMLNSHSMLFDLQIARSVFTLPVPV